MILVFLPFSTLSSKKYFHLEVNKCMDYGNKFKIEYQLLIIFTKKLFKITYLCRRYHTLLEQYVSVVVFVYVLLNDVLEHFEWNQKPLHNRHIEISNVPDENYPHVPYNLGDSEIFLNIEYIDCYEKVL